MATNSLIKKLLTCLFVLSISWCLCRAYADEFYSPVQMQYGSWMASKSQFLTKINDENGRYFAIYKDENDHYGAYLDAPPEGMPRYAGNLVIPDFVEFTVDKDEIIQVPVLDVTECAFEESDVKQITLNNIIQHIEQFWALGSCDHLTKIIIPWESGVNINDARITKSLKEVIFGKAVNLSWMAFEGSFEKLDFSGRKVIFGLDGFTFLQVKHLIFPSDIVFPKVSEGYIKTIERLDFVGTEMPDNNMLFDAGSLSAMSSLMEMHCQWVTPPGMNDNADTDSYNGCSGIYDRCTLYVPAGSVEAYRTAPGWKNFKNILAETEGVDGIGSDRTVSSVERYDLMGRPVAAPVKGSIVIERTTYSDGTTQTTRRLAR